MTSRRRGRAASLSGVGVVVVYYYAMARTALARPPFDGSPNVAAWCSAITGATENKPEASARLALKSMLSVTAGMRTKLCQSGKHRRPTENLDRDAARCGGVHHADGAAVVPSPRFLGLLGEDWWIYANHARFMDGPGTYVDVAANDPIAISNSFFFDACLRWDGLCVEANPRHTAALKSARACAVEQKCMADRKFNTSFVSVNDPTGGRSHLGASTDKDTARSFETIQVQCDTLAATLQAHAITHIDYFSLDVERHEQMVLDGLDLDAVTIDVVIMEGHFDDRPARVFLDRGYRRIDYLGKPCVMQSAYVRPGFQLGIERAGHEILTADDWWDPAQCGGAGKKKTS